jgi:hypothetical protein
MRRLPLARGVVQWSQLICEGGQRIALDDDAAAIEAAHGTHHPGSVFDELQVALS